ncbi:hypothetical protein Clacol_008282 [Clathrus columnatus]|uniref:Protein S-acyltransferase n=1 Tax=Clathrus columnatus TaxID=1419009 RepID=A0AAV5AI10_9AGAM|nr:hypothetical protein Clacol_008282 [Clathrus columnatus]
MPFSGGGSSTRNSCTSCSDIINESRERHARKDGRQPWLARKLAVAIVIGLVGYTYYVYVVTFCIPMVQQHRNALGNKRIGIAFLVTFNILFLMFVWTYAKVVFTSPGYALEHTHPTPPPVSRTPEPYRADNYNTATDSRAYDDESHLTEDQNSVPRQSTDINMSESRYSRPSVGRGDDLQTSPMDTLPPVAAGRAARDIGNIDIEEGLPPPFYSRRPPTHPVLSPEFRYCTRDGIVKPMRTHHCRACGTCILNVLVMYARLGTLDPEPRVNAQHFVILGLSFIFTLFPLLLLMSQVYLVVFNMTTVEHLHVQRMQERESGILAEMTGHGLLCSGSRDGPRQRQRRHRPDISNLKRPYWPWEAFILRRQIREQWDREWGKLGTEGNIWWLGSKRANWEATMGKSKWSWFCDGLYYPRNPRFDPEGRWRRRPDWPEGLR